MDSIAWECIWIPVVASSLFVHESFFSLILLDSSFKGDDGINAFVIGIGN